VEYRAEYGSSEYYRERAAELFRLAEAAADDNLRQSYLSLAAMWEHLARQLE
jgi:hypothetical protein